MATPPAFQRPGRTLWLLVAARACDVAWPSRASKLWVALGLWEEETFLMGTLFYFLPMQVLSSSHSPSPITGPGGSDWRNSFQGLLEPSLAPGQPFPLFKAPLGVTAPLPYPQVLFSAAHLAWGWVGGSCVPRNVAALWPREHMALGWAAAGSVGSHRGLLCCLWEKKYLKAP